MVLLLVAAAVVVGAVDFDRLRRELERDGAVLPLGLTPAPHPRGGVGLYFTNASTRHVEIRIPAKWTVCARNADQLVDKVCRQMRTTSWFQYLPPTPPPRSEFVLEWTRQELEGLADYRLARRIANLQTRLARQFARLGGTGCTWAELKLAKYWVMSRSFGVGKARDCLVCWADFANHAETEGAFTAWNWMEDQDAFQLRSHHPSLRLPGSEFTFRYQTRLDSSTSLVDYGFVDMSSREQLPRWFACPPGGGDGGSGGNKLPLAEQYASKAQQVQQVYCDKVRRCVRRGWRAVL